MLQLKSAVIHGLFLWSLSAHSSYAVPSECSKGHLLTYRGTGCEGWAALFSSAATSEQAKGVRDRMMSETDFNTSSVPLPTLGKSNYAYGPTTYWRGRVWLDQFYFGVKGLVNYGFEKDAYELIKKLFKNAQGLIGMGEINENYNPENGTVIGAPNFGWSAAHLLMMYDEIITKPKSAAEETKLTWSDFKGKVINRDISTEPLYMKHLVGNNFYDEGAWFGFATKANEHAFVGPYIVFEEYPAALFRKFEQMTLKVGTKPLTLKSESSAYPGGLQLVTNGTLTGTANCKVVYTRDLVFHNYMHAVIQNVVKLEGAECAKMGAIDATFSGSPFTDVTAAKSVKTLEGQFKTLWTIKGDAKDGIIIDLGTVRKNSILTQGQKFAIRFLGDGTTFEDVSASHNEKNGGFDYKYTVKGIKDGQTFYTVLSHSPSPKEELTALPLGEAKAAVENSHKRWNEYISNLFSSRQMVEGFLDPKASEQSVNEASIQNVMVKAMETLMMNYRHGPAGEVLKSSGMVPSVTVGYFNGFWAWDSWKMAAGAALFNREVAKQAIQMMFDHQITKTDELRPYDHGMIIDAVFYNKDKFRGGEGGNWNERNSKPPLTAWAVSKIFKNDEKLSEEDKKYLEQLLPKLAEYNAWWYRNRDVDQNEVPEYGGTRHAYHNDDSGELYFEATYKPNEKLDNLANFAKSCKKLSTTRDNEAMLDFDRLETPRTSRREDNFPTPREDDPNDTYACYGSDLYLDVLEDGRYIFMDLPIRDGTGWESGMDNAARFGFIEEEQLKKYIEKETGGDRAKALKQWTPRFYSVKGDYNGKKSAVGFTIDQESVDLQGFLINEYVALSELSGKLGKKDDADKYAKKATEYKEYVQKCFYDEKTQFFYDRRMDYTPARDTPTSDAHSLAITLTALLITGVAALLF